MLQRIRELAVQSANGTMNDSDRASLDAEVQALKTEIDRVAETTSFNNRALLDGTFAAKFQIGHEAGQTVSLGIGSVKTDSLGLGGGSAGANSIVGGRMSLASFAEGDIKINGQDVGAFTAASPADGTDVENVLKAINNNVDNVEATAFNTVVAKNKGNGVTDDGDFTIAVNELGVGTATTFNISASNSMDELVANINHETGGVVAASLTDDGKLVLSNETGATITITDGSASTGNYDGGSGFLDSSTPYAGFIRLSSLDGSSVQVERGNLGLSSPGTETDLAALGFRETNRQSLTDAYTITGIELTSAGATGTWTQSDLAINGVEMYDENISTATIEGKVNTINAFSGETGVSASAVFEHVFDMSDAWTGTSVTNSGTDYDTADLIYVNGTSVAYGASLSALVTALNATGVKDVTGLTASSNGTNLILKGNGITTVKFEMADSTGLLGGQTNATTSGALINDDTYYGRIRLDSLNNTPISIALGDSATVAEHGFLETGVGAADFEVNDTMLSAGGGSSISGLSVASSAGAENALATLDNAINSVNEIRGDLGAIQNRLEYTINNLSSISNATEGARGRIVDADYAKETSALTKQQILSQAATSMLAQANQSKQSVLALLQS